MSTTTQQRKRNSKRHAGAVQVRGMIRRVWRPRYLEIDKEGVLRYYEAVPTSNTSSNTKRGDIRNELQAFTLSKDLQSLSHIDEPDDDHVLVDTPQEDEDWNAIEDEKVEVILDPSTETNTTVFQNDSQEQQEQVPLHQIHNHRPKAIMTILSARIIDTSSLRDVHVGLPQNSFGFVFCGRQVFTEQQENFEQSISSLNESHEIRDDVCHPLSILHVNENYFDTSRDYLCAVSSEQEAIRWVKELKWAAEKAYQSKSKWLEDGEEIHMRGSFDEGLSPIRLTHRSHKHGIFNDLVLDYENTNHGLDKSLLSDTSTVLTDPMGEGYTIVTKVQNFNICKKDWVRLVGIKCDIVYEIQLLLLGPYHLVNRATIHTECDSLNDDELECWTVEQRTIFRTFQEVLDLLSFGFKDTESVADVTAAMTSLDFGKIFGVKDELVKSCEYVDKALRLITSDPELCDSMMVKSFLGLSTNGDSLIVPRVRRDCMEATKMLSIPCGQSVDTFVKSWVFQVEKHREKNIHWTKYAMLSMRNPMVESVVSIKAVYLATRAFSFLCSSPSTMNVRSDAMLVICGGFFYSGYKYGLKKGGETEKIREKSGMTIRGLPEKRNHMQRTDEDTENPILDNDDYRTNEAHVLSSPLPKYPDNEGNSCWSEPRDDIFKVRGKTYLRDRIKIPSGPAPFKSRGCDMWLTDNPERNISRLPCVLGKKLREKDTFLVNFLLPFGNFVMYFSVDEEAMPNNARDVWNKFKNGDQLYRDARLKLLPLVIEGPWIVKKAVGPGKAPALLSQSIPLQYYFKPATADMKAVYEVDVIITASRIAKGILNVVKSHTKKLTIALSIIIEATNEQELPEIVLCSTQLHNLNLEHCPQLPKYFPLEVDDDDGDDYTVNHS